MAATERYQMMIGPENWRIGYPGFLMAMVVIGLGNYFLLKWLENRNRRRYRPAAVNA